MGSGASTLHEEEYVMFLELPALSQQYWLRKIPSDQLPLLQARTFDLPPSLRIPLLHMVRDLTSRGGSSSRPVTRELLLGGMPSGELPGRGLIHESFLPEATLKHQKSDYAAQYIEEEYPSAPATPGDAVWLSPLGSGGDSNTGREALNATKTRLEADKAAQAEEKERTELLKGMVDAQREEKSGGRVVVLKLVDVGLDFELSEIQPVLSPVLQQINLCRNRTLRGDLSRLSGCTRLVDLCLEGTQVSGDLSSLANLKKLSKVQLSDLNIGGSIESLKGCAGLKKVWLRGCVNVVGDIGVAFENTPLLLDVLLRRTQVHGNLAVFENCKRLQNVSCSRTHVFGTVDVFRGCHALKVLALDFCPHIIGEREDLEEALPLCTIDF